MKRRFIFFILFLFQFILIYKNLFGVNSVATLGSIQGQVSITDQATQSSRIVSESALVKPGQFIATAKNSIASIIFRDGSRIRLFPESKLIIENGIEFSGKNRRFAYHLFMEKGSFWGKFIKHLQKTSIKTPTINIEVEEAQFRLEHTKDVSNVSLSMGSLKLKNEAQEHVLSSGQIASNIPLSEKFSDQIKPLKHTLLLTANQKNISFPKNATKPIKIIFTLQLFDVVKQQDIHQSGKLYFTSNIDKFKFPKNLSLSKRGYAYTEVDLYPLNQKDYQQGQIHVTVILDAASFINIGDASLTFNLSKTFDKETFQIDTESGNIYRDILD